jgi:hypothetical protein
MIKTAFQVMHMCPEKGFCCLLGRHCFASRSVLELYRVQPCLVHPVDAWAPLKKKKKADAWAQGSSLLLGRSRWSARTQNQNAARRKSHREQRFFKILLVELHLMQHRQDRFFSYSGAKQAKAGPWRFKGFFFTFIQYT